MLNGWNPQRFRFTCSEKDAPPGSWSYLRSDGQKRSSNELWDFIPVGVLNLRILYRKIARPFSICGWSPLGWAEAKVTASSHRQGNGAAARAWSQSSWKQNSLNAPDHPSKWPVQLPGGRALSAARGGSFLISWSLDHRQIMRNTFRMCASVPGLRGSPSSLGLLKVCSEQLTIAATRNAPNCRRRVPCA